MDPKRAKRLIANRQVGLPRQQLFLACMHLPPGGPLLSSVLNAHQSPVTASWHCHILACLLPFLRWMLDDGSCTMLRHPRAG